MCTSCFFFMDPGAITRLPSNPSTPKGGVVRGPRSHSGPEILRKVDLVFGPVSLFRQKTYALPRQAAAVASPRVWLLAFGLKILRILHSVSGVVLESPPSGS